MCISLCAVKWSVTSPAQDWLDLHPSVRRGTRHPAGLERTGFFFFYLFVFLGVRGVRGRQVFFDWTG